jgi:adenylate cyclase
MAEQVFVGREEELRRLWQFLDRALDSQGQVCFVSGEAGSGKTALVSEFAIRAQEEYGDLVVAIGQCDAHIGIGDPYLPFREVLCQLTGDVEGKLARGAITRENASRLRKLVAVSAQILVDVAPDLIGLFVPGAKIVGELGKAVAEKGGWMAKLEKLGRQPRAGSVELDQARVFEQYTDVLRALAQKQPLLLILDDLHWADAGSISLLFRLGRRIDGSRILVVGTYRPEEVALERLGERHPLQKVLAEFRRYFGEIWVDLDQAREAEGRQFVGLWLATEPNRLSAEFVEVLYQRTRGHPLFTIELVRDMQERGVLVQDERGEWREGPQLDWTELPDRVEGLIEERIGRLEEPLQNILSVASVEGQDFTAQVIAGVADIAERSLLRMLSLELETRHRLVRELEGVELGQKFLARYQFAHTVFQQYLYHGLGAAERRLLHGQVAALLEALYRGYTERIAVPLARHFSEAGADEKASDYLLQAGDAAARLYAYAEARLHYSRALESLAQLPDTLDSRRRRADALIDRVAVSWMAEPAAENLERLAEAERLLAGVAGGSDLAGSDRVRLAWIHYYMGRIHYTGMRMADAIAYYRRVLPVAQEIGDPELLGLPSSAMGQALVVQGRNGEAEPLLRQALTALERAGNRSLSLLPLAFHGFAVAVMGDYALGRPEIENALASARELGHFSTVSTIQLLQVALHGLTGRSRQGMAAAHEAVAVAEASGDLLVIYNGNGWLAWAEGEAGLFEAAEASMSRAQSVAEVLGGRLVLAHFFLAARARLALGAGRVQEALALAERAAATAQETDNPQAEGYARQIWAQALAALDPPQRKEAEAQFAQGLRLYERGKSRLWVARAHTVWGGICRDLGDPVAAQEHWQEAKALWQASGVTWEADSVHALMATLPRV